MNALDKLRARCVCGRVARDAGTPGSVSREPCHYCEIAEDVEAILRLSEDRASALRYVKGNYHSDHLYGVGWDRLALYDPPAEGGA